MKRLLVPLLLALAGCSRDGAAKPPGSVGAAEPVSIDVKEVLEVPMDRTLPIVGTLFAKDSAMVAAEVEGRVEKTMAEFGDRLEEGQELVLVDTDTYTALANLAGARVQQARAAEVAAEHELKRQNELRKGGIASPADFDAAVAAADEARAAVKAAEANEVVARLNVERSRIRAPFEAAVAERIASAGDFVKSGAPLFRLVNDAVLKFIVQAPESFAPQVVKGLPVEFSVDAYPGRKFEGKVFLVSPQVNLATRMFDFGALVPNADRVLKAGTFARGELILEKSVPTLTVPVESLVVGSGVTRVFVLTNNAVTSRIVQPGRIANGRQEVLSGLRAGEKVATSGQGKLTEGTVVRVKG